jgi:hypothetical protein
MARKETRHHVTSSEKQKRWLAEVAEIAKIERRYSSALIAYLPIRQRLDKLRDIHAGLVDVIRSDKGRALKRRTAGAVPDDLDVPGHNELVKAIQRVEPWLPPSDAHVRGSAIDDPPDVVRVLIALDRGHTLTAACQLALKASARTDASRTPAGDQLRKRVKRCGAYARWRAALEEEIASAHSVGRESRDDQELRVDALRKLLARHG